MCRDCADLAPNSRIAKNWIVVFGLPINVYEKGEFSLSPWFVLCNKCCAKHDVPDWVRGVEPNGSE